MKKNFSIKKVNIDVYDDTKVEVFSSPLNPSIDAKIALEMNSQEDIARRFAKSSSTSIQEMKTFLSPT